MTAENKPLFEKIYEDLLNKIINGEYSIGQLVPTELQLARDYKVSRITSKRALEELRQQGYIFRQRGKGSFVATRQPGKVSSRIPDVIALVVPFSELIDSAMQLISGITSVFNSSGLYLSVLNSHSKIPAERKILESIVKDGVKGLILYPSSSFANVDVLLRHTMNNFPVVTIDKYYEGMNLNTVVSDNYDGGYQAAAHLCELNHLNMVFVSDIELGTVSSLRDRYMGFCRAQLDRHVNIGENNFCYIGRIPYTSILDSTCGNVINDSGNLDAWKSALSHILDRQNPPTAICAAYDYLGICLLKTAQAMGISIPRDLSVIGFDNIAVGAYLDIPLTTVSQDFQQIGQTAAETMVSLLQGKGQGKKNKILIPVKLIVRQSTGALQNT